MKKYLGILLIIVLLLTGCNSKKEIKEETKEDIVETTITDDMNAKLDRFIDALQLKYINVTNDEIPINEKLYYAFYIASDELHSDSVSKEDIEKTVYELFGSKTEYKDKNIESIFTDETIAYYKKGKYVYNHDTAHGVPMVKGDTYEVSRKRENEIIKVEVKRVYINCGDTCPVDAVYKDPEYKEKYDVPEKYCSYDEYMPDFCDIEVEDFLKDNLDIIPTLTLEFELENNNPVFKRLYK